MFKDLNKKQLISLLFLVVVLSGIIGWIYEVIFYYFNGGMKTIYNRGGNFLPFINIYAFGALLIIFLTYKQLRHPFKVFLICVISTGILEYLTGYILYGVLKFNRAWDYNVEILNFGNINGYVCLRSVLVFGILGLGLMYLIIPMLKRIVKSKYSNLIFIISVIIFSIFMIDEIYNLIIVRLFNLRDASEIYKSIGIKYPKFK